LRIVLLLKSLNYDVYMNCWKSSFYLLSRVLRGGFPERVCFFFLFLWFKILYKFMIKIMNYTHVDQK